MNPVIKYILIGVLKVAEILAPELSGLCEAAIAFLEQQKAAAAQKFSSHVGQLVAKDPIKPQVAAPPDLVKETD